MRIFAVLPCLVFYLCSCSETDSTTNLNPHTYPFSSEVVFDEPTLFAPGSISTMDYELNNLFSHDLKTIYFTKSTAGFGLMTMVKSEYENGSWTDPKILPFSGQYVDVDPYLSPDGFRMFFISQRPNPGESTNDYDVYSVDKNDEGWTEPKRLEAPVNSDQPEYYPAVSNDGTLYLSTVRKQGEGSFDLYRSKSNEDGSYSELENLGPAVNSESAEIDVYVNPEEAYIIFVSYRPDGYGSGDLYVSFNEDGAWSEAKNLGEPVNSTAREYTPMVTPDGRFLFYTSERGFTDERLNAPLTAEELQTRLRHPGNELGDIYFVELSTLEPFKNR